MSIGDRVGRRGAWCALVLALPACGSGGGGMDAASSMDGTVGLDAVAEAGARDVIADDGPGTLLRVGEPGGCNGLVSSCSRTYDRVTIAATHDAFSYATGGPVHYLAPNQDLPIPDQLAAGIRGLGLRPSPYYGTDATQTDRVYVTHNGAQLHGAIGQEPFDGVLARIKAFLDANPREVITLYMESGVTPAQVAAVFDEVGLTPELFVFDPARGWPTLQEMIDAGMRLVAFNDSQDATRPPWMLYLYDQIVDTDYNVTDPSQFSCGFYRGQAGNPIYYLNHFVYADLGMGILVPDRAQAQVVNAAPFVVARVQQCLAAVGRRASVVYVDWFGQGDVVDAVDTVNRMAVDDAGM